MNHVVLVGRLTADPELRSTSGGTSYCRFTVAVDRAFAKSGEERKADFIGCVAWDKTAEFVSRYFSKGRWIGVQGSIETGSYTNREGAKVYTTDVRVSNVEFVGNKSDSGSSYTGNRSAGSEQRRDNAPAPSYSNGSADDFVQDPIDDDLPF